MPWSAHDYLTLYRQILHLIEEIDPAVVAVEPCSVPEWMPFERWVAGRLNQAKKIS